MAYYAIVIAYEGVVMMVSITAKWVVVVCLISPLRSRIALGVGFCQCILLCVPLVRDMRGCCLGLGRGGAAVCNSQSFYIDRSTFSIA